MSLNVTETALTAVQERAALLVAEDRETDDAIAAECGITKRTLERWKKGEPFAARVAEHRQAWRDATMQTGIADRVNRVSALHDRWERMRRVVDARGLDMSGVDKDGLPAIPGGETGLLVRQTKSIGFGPNNMVVEEYAVDAGLLKELRAHEEQAAKELGQWVDKRELDGTVNFLDALRAFGRDSNA